MNDLLDEVTVPIQVKTRSEEAQVSGTLRLNSLNAIKNQARYDLAQRDNMLFDNPLLRVSSELLSLVISVKRLESPSDMFAFRTGLKGRLTDLKFKVTKLDYPPSVADKACFLFAVMLDEQILHSSWGEDAGWQHQTLVSELFGVKNGGEQFYLVAERALLQPVLLKDLIELIYLMIKLGFRGRYRVDGKELLGVLVQRLEEAIFIDNDSAESGPLSKDKKLVIERLIAAATTRSVKPQKPIKLQRSAMFFAALITVCWGAVAYWYSAIVPQNAQAFSQLPAFTEQYYRQANVQEQEYVYTSNDDDLKPVSSKGIGAIASSNSQGNWRVQLATLSSKSSAQQFLLDNGGLLPNAEVRRLGNFYIVTTYVSSSREAQEVLNTAKKAGIDDAFVIKAKQ
ncbi:type IVB secretion system protein IcmH/DotU [Vibrio fluminensis]|uniref:type IVB secretion system protein IcmH/DotU n=1 Tax=Vibrio fluminensis TaxID=2783614 RepID=UPI001888EFA7|nr:type IVB secretion system protein IcmH/DotU [Vibrio fluminensis]